MDKRIKNGIQFSLFESPRTVFVMIGRMPKFGVRPKESITFSIEVPNRNEESSDWARETLINLFAKDQKIDPSLVWFFGMW